MTVSHWLSLVVGCVLSAVMTLIVPKAWDTWTTQIPEVYYEKVSLNGLQPSLLLRDEVKAVINDTEKKSRDILLLDAPNNIVRITINNGTKSRINDLSIYLNGLYKAYSGSTEVSVTGSVVPVGALQPKQEEEFYLLAKGYSSGDIAESGGLVVSDGKGQQLEVKPIAERFKFVLFTPGFTLFVLVMLGLLILLVWAGIKHDQKVAKASAKKSKK